MFLKSFEKLAISGKLYASAVKKAIEQRGGGAAGLKSVVSRVGDKYRKAMRQAQNDVLNPSSAPPMSKQLKRLKHTQIRNMGIPVIEEAEKKLK